MSAQPTTIEIATAEFQAGATAILRSWSALKTAVESEWGGVASKEKAEFLRSHIFEAFDYKKGKASIDMYELEDNLAIYLEEEFSIVVEDESEKEVARLITEMFDQCGNGNFTLAREVVAKANAAAQANTEKAMVQSNGELDEDSDDEMDASPSTNSAQDYAGEYLFGAPAGQAQRVSKGPVRQLGEAAPEKAQPEVDDDGFTTVPTKGRRR